MTIDGKAHLEALFAESKLRPVPKPTYPYHDPSSFNHKFATVSGGYRYHYVEEGNTDAPTILMIHGFPDLWYGWRHQIRHLADKGYHVIAVDTLGYGQSDAPVFAPEELHPYGMKSICQHLADILDVAKVQKAIILGHDWGGFTAWRFADYKPDRVKAVISVCTPLHPPSDVFVPLEQAVQYNPNFAYMMFFADPSTTDLINNTTREFLDNMLRYSKIHDEELDYYVEQFSRNGFHGPLNYYRTSKINWEEEVRRPSSEKRKHQSFLIAATDERVLTPNLSDNMHLLFDNFERVFVKAGHFALTEAPKEVNEHLDNMLLKILGPLGPKATI